MRINGKYLNRTLSRYTRPVLSEQRNVTYTIGEPKKKESWLSRVTGISDIKVTVDMTEDVKKTILFTGLGIGGGLAALGFFNYLKR